MSQLPVRPTIEARVRAAWQEQVAAAHNTPGLLPELMRRRQELLPTFALHYTQLRALPRRVRRALQRKWKQSVAGMALLLALGASPGQAATIPVSATCSLINAITAANTDTATGGCPAGNGADTIRLPAGSTQTLTAVNNMTEGEHRTHGPTGLPVVSSQITIEGNGSTIQRESSAPDFRILAVCRTGDLTLKETTVSGGAAGSGGGGVFNYAGSLTLTNSTLSGNTGGGVRNSSYHDYGYFIPALLSIENSTLSGNTGGGVDNSEGIITIANSTLSGNSTGFAGGGVYSYRGSLTITNSTLSGNSASYDGGGVRTYGVHPLTIINSTFSNNSAPRGGGVTNLFGTVTLTNSTLVYEVRFL